MSHSIERQRLCSRLGYSFQNPDLLDLALSHRSVGAHNNERLEFLGDSLLNFYIAESLYHKFPKTKEGQLSRLRANLVCGETLAAIARDFGIGDCMNLGAGELKSGGFRRDSILADAVEALIGAIYLDSGDQQCRERVLVWYQSRLEELDLDKQHKDAKTRLQEYLQSRKQALPSYAVIDTSGEAHAQLFTVSCEVASAGQRITATGSSRKSAEQKAAAQMLSALGVA